MAVGIESLGIDRLSVSERLDLIEQIWNSLPEQMSPQDIPHWHFEEIERRRTQRDLNPSAGKPWRSSQSRGADFVNLPVVLRPEAELDIEQAHAYLEAVRPELGRRFYVHLRELLRTLGISTRTVRSGLPRRARRTDKAIPISRLLHSSGSKGGHSCSPPRSTQRERVAIATVDSRASPFF